MSRTIINEKSTAYLTAAFFDKAGTAAVPASVSYRVDCMTTGAAVRASTAIAAASSVEITLDTDDTAIQSDANALERKRVTVVATYGAGDALRDVFEFAVRNLSGVS